MRKAKFGQIMIYGLNLDEFYAVIYERGVLMVNHDVLILFSDLFVDNNQNPSFFS